MRETVTDIEKLREIAIDQHGYVTTSQAEQVGVSRPSLSYLAKNGRIDRPIRGVYRVPQVPVTQYDAIHLALLWADAENAVLSHDTALHAWGVSDINPTKIHLTVPPGHRTSRGGGDNVVIHKQAVTKKQMGWWEQMPIVKLPIAIDQCVDRGVSSHIITQAIMNGRARGMLSDVEAGCLYSRLESRNENR